MVPYNIWDIHILKISQFLIIFYVAPQVGSNKREKNWVVGGKQTAEKSRILGSKSDLLFGGLQDQGKESQMDLN